MSNQDTHLLKARMVRHLDPIFGLREASNMTAFYFDAVDSYENIDRDIKSLESGIPVQYVSNTSFFYGHRFYVDENVLIPRPETEELVHWIIEDHMHTEKELNILDIGSGSGCIILSLLLKLTNAKGKATDIEPGALSVIRKNASRFSINLDIEESDVLSINPEDLKPQYDIIVCNPPYILESEAHRMDQSVLDHEPKSALFVSGTDPLVFYIKIIDLATKWLLPSGKLYFETSDIYHDRLEFVARHTDFKYQFQKDMQDNWRMLRLINN